MTIEVKTRRLRLVAATIESATAEAEHRSGLARLLGANVPDDWPPEILREAQDFFLGLYRAHPEWSGWLQWYGILADHPEPVLCGSVGFLGPPDSDGMVEIGYSVLPTYQGRGIATEMVGGLVGWSFHQTGVRCVEAETASDNAGSVWVLKQNAFHVIGPGSEPRLTRYRLEK